MAKKDNLMDQSQWYVITTISGNEDSVVQNLKSKIKAYKLDDLIQDIKVIKEETKTIEEFTADDVPSSMNKNLKNTTWSTLQRNGKTVYVRTKTQNKNLFLGYIFIKMIMTEEAWFTIRNTQLITGIVGSSGKNAKPVPVSEYEIQRILDNNNKEPLSQEQVDGGIHKIESNEDEVVISKKEYVCNFEVNQNVKILGSQMTGQVGVVKSISTTKGTAIIAIDMFGRTMEIELGFDEVEKTTLE